MKNEFRDIFNILYWREEQNKNKPQLYEIAKVTLTVPVTQVSVERLFSAVKFIMNPNRPIIHETLNAVTIIRFNSDLF